MINQLQCTTFNNANCSGTYLCYGQEALHDGDSLFQEGNGHHFCGHPSSKLLRNKNNKYVTSQIPRLLIGVAGWLWLTLLVQSMQACTEGAFSWSLLMLTKSLDGTIAINNSANGNRKAQLVWPTNTHRESGGV